MTQVWDLVREERTFREIQCDVMITQGGDNLLDVSEMRLHIFREDNDII